MKIEFEAHMKFKDGDKVRVKPHICWPEGAVGTVSIQPDFVKEVIGKEASMDSTQRTVKGKVKIITSMWVDFDEPANDCSDDGPYIGGEVQIEYLIKI
ncbi:MAG: hypothetical protein CME33_09350 [Gimesia sp.]|uniref:hypothetical protein n=1 Tax=Gimesia sp. TaxID=2024833 RepID=UPI000C3F306C|nr:hypothetical protein [Gimesia sp.]MAX36755.1 hypothetical protein [Gimesia sp.]|tara:strand:+ start:118 stop:411 length:294 start_codon:yes stop_codon:yes gene_type:complete